MTMTCEQARELLDALALDALDEPEASAAAEHISACPECAAEFDEAREAAAALGLAAPAHRLGDAARARVLEALHEPRPAQVRVPRQWMRMALAAAAVLLVAGLGTWGTMLQLRVNHLEGSPTALSPTDPAAALMALAIQPDAKIADLTSSGGQAAARYAWYPGGPGVLVSHDLPALPPGHVYALWFVGDGNASLGGTFQPDASGSATLLVQWPPGYFDTIRVAMHASDAVTAGSGQVVLQGQE